MNTTYSIWHELAILASYPGGYVLPLGALLIFFLAVWAVFNRIGSAFVITETKPPVRIDQDFAKRDQDARRIHALIHPQPPRPWGESAAKGSKRAYSPEHHAPVVNFESRRTGR